MKFSQKKFPKFPQNESGITKDVLRKKRKKPVKKKQQEQNSHKH